MLCFIDMWRQFISETHWEILVISEVINVTIVQIIPDHKYAKIKYADTWNVGDQKSII